MDLQQIDTLIITTITSVLTAFPTAPKYHSAILLRIFQELNSGHNWHRFFRPGVIPETQPTASEFKLYFN